MNYRTIALILWGILIASAAVAEEKYETRLEVKTGDADDHVFVWSSDDADADFSTLEVGESRTVTGDDGKEVTVTRTEKGLALEVDGKTIDVPHFGGDGDIHVDVEVLHDGDGKVIVNKTKDVRIIRTDAADGVTIISSSELDDDTRAKLESVLKEAGKEGDVMFLDGSELHGDAQAHGEHEVRIIKETVEETED